MQLISFNRQAFLCLPSDKTLASEKVSKSFFYKWTYCLVIKIFMLKVSKSVDFVSAEVDRAL